MKHMEIERKWQLDAFPDGLPLVCEQRVEQGYLAFEPVTVRIRKTVEQTPEAGLTRHVLTIKGGGGLMRTEVEPTLSADEYAALLPLLAAPPVQKLYRQYRLPDGLLLECNWVDAGEPTGFLYAEVEFPSAEEARAFCPPAFVGRERTGDKNWSMAAYCRRKTKKER